MSAASLNATTAGLVSALTVSQSAPPELVKLSGELVEAWTSLRAAQQTIHWHGKAMARLRRPAIADPLAMAEARKAIDIVLPDPHGGIGMPATATVSIDPARLARVTKLDQGKHNPPNGEFAACVMEAVAYVAGLPWSDHPECTCPVITAFMVAWNDGLPDAERTALLLPLVPKLVGTRGSKALEHRRSLMAADWLVRTHTPAWLRLAGLTAQADALSSLPEITSMAMVPSIRGPIAAAQRDAAAARAAARAAAWDAAWDAARDAARAAAWDAAWAAARDAAWDAATKKLAATKAELQQSAVALVERMIAAKDDDAKAEAA